MRYELTDNEWSAIKPMLTSSPRTTLRSFNSHRSGYGCALMSPS
jgi:transposase